jgi:hypothetical protein
MLPTVGLLDDLMEGPRLFLKLADALVPGSAPPAESVQALRASLQHLADLVGEADLKPLFSLLDDLERSAAQPPSAQRVQDLERELTRLREELRRTQQRSAQARPPPPAATKPPPPAATKPPPPQPEKPADPPKPDRFELIEID